MWEVIESDTRVNVMPIGDLIEHQESSVCPCNPTVEHYARELLIHHSADGRESFEGMPSVSRAISKETVN